MMHPTTFPRKPLLSPRLLTLLSVLLLGGIAQAVPVQGTVSGTATEEPTRNPNVLAATIIGTGHFSEIGQSTVQATHLINTRTLAFADGQLVIVGEKGVLYATYAGQFIPTSTPGFFTFDAPLVIIGGTGKFAGATGSGSLIGQVDATAQPEHFTALIDVQVVLPKP